MPLMSRIMRRKAPEAPQPLGVSWEPGRVLCPADGVAVELVDVPDPVFSTGMLGPGLAVDPSSDAVFSPVGGTVMATVGSGHAFHLVCDDGLEVLVHAGIDTVRLRGEGFFPHVGKGDRVDAGQALLTFDRDRVRAAELCPLVVLTLPNAPSAQAYTLLVDGGDGLSAGDVVASAPMRA